MNILVLCKMLATVAVTILLCNSDVFAGRSVSATFHGNKANLTVNGVKQELVSKLVDYCKTVGGNYAETDDTKSCSLKADDAEFFLFDGSKAAIIGGPSVYVTVSLPTKDLSVITSSYNIIKERSYSIFQGALARLIISTAKNYSSYWHTNPDLVYSGCTVDGKHYSPISFAGVLACDHFMCLKATEYQPTCRIVTHDATACKTE